MQNNQQSVNEIRALMTQWGEALYNKDLEAMHQDYASTGYKLFDVKETAETIETVKKLWEQCLPFFDKPKVEYKDMVINATDDMGLVHFRSRITGTIHATPPEIENIWENIWLRGTVVYQKIDNKWQCIHEHISLPVDCETMKVAQA